MPVSNNLIVNYKLSAENAAQINRRRTTSTSIAERIKDKRKCIEYKHFNT